jgi:hypothetical protein
MKRQYRHACARPQIEPAGYNASVCSVAPVGAGLSLIALLVLWSWVSRPIWWDPFFRDDEAQRQFRDRVSARKAPLAVVGASLLFFVTLAAVAEC